MKLIYLHQYFTTPKYFGGVRSFEFARRLVEQGHAVDMVSSTAFFPVAKKPWWRLVSRVDVDGISVHAIHVAYSNKMSFARRVVAFFLFTLVASVYVTTLRGRDIVFASSTPLTIGIPALAGKWWLGIPLVFEVRDLWPDVPIAMGYIRNRAAIAALHWFERFLYFQATRIVALSVGMRDGIIGKGIDGTKVVVVPNACDMEQFSEVTGAPDPVAALKQQADTKVCVYAGTFGYVNDLSYVISLAKEVRLVRSSVKFVLVGDGVERAKLLRAIQREGLQDTVTIVGPVAREELAGYLRATDACISTVKNVPALFNNSANKFFDALAAGKPIIINHGGWQADFIRRNGCGLVLDYDFARSAHQLVSFLETWPAHGGEGIRALAEREFSRDLLFRRLLCEALEPALLSADV